MGIEKRVFVVLIVMRLSLLVNIIINKFSWFRKKIWERSRERKTTR